MFETTAGERLDDVLFGMSLGAALGVGFSCWLAAIRVASGPDVIERVGLTWGELATLYYVGCVAAGSAFGALERVRHRAPGAILQQLVMAVPPMVAIPLNMGLSYGRPPLPPRVLVIVLMAVAVGAGWFGFWQWREDSRANPPAL
jgi:hypothetical protein